MKPYLLQISRKNEDEMLEFFKANYIDLGVSLRTYYHEDNLFLNLFGLSDVERTTFILEINKKQIDLTKNKLKSLKDKNSFLLKFNNQEKEMIDEDQKLIVTIISAGFADVIIDIGKKCGETGATTLSGKGMGANYSSFLGMSLDSEKDVILIISNNTRYLKTMSEIKKTILQNKNAQGICFALPVSEFLRFE